MWSRYRGFFRQYDPQFWLMVSGNLISTAGASMVTPFLMIYATDKLGIPLSTAVTLITINAGTTLVSSPVAGTLADKVGRKLVLNMSLTLSGLTYLGLRFAVTYPSLAALMACLGLANALYSVGADAMMADLVPSEQRVDAYAINRMMNNAGFAIGPAVGGFVAATSYKLSFLAGAIGMLTYSLLMFFLARETLERSRQPPSAAAAIQGYAKSPISESARQRNEGFGKLLRDGRYLAFLGTMSLGLIAPMLLWVFLAVYTKNYFGMPENVYGWLPTTNALMCVFVQYAVTRITRRHSTLPVVAAGMLIYALGVGSVAVMSGFWGFWISM
ncbi:MAG TPA: MFS transporter, partial [Anaerolineales bacterium]